ncbi:tRNA(fMet)-specific endonuclease VapC [Luteimicrobium xylanilyticum]|uniref:Ribonuclease VapC n=1 Tax=Luteimicrobium xylanilyticum TaxID=1133546 RepID=A0A5P9Q6B5_9MICO|nr:PIN domain-containing protein [Luteimicrobium xylanilyticum]QFU96938.1 Ribonuclease VapC2 [Luteimicrobium xylanilyticum]
MTARQLFVLDTDVVIDVLRSRSPLMLERFSEHGDALTVSAVTVAELHFGAARSSAPSSNRAAVEEFLAFLEVLPFDAAAAAHAGEIRGALTAAGTPIGGYDVLIAGHARSVAAVLVTGNVREFSRVDGLRVVDWGDR